jgi:hypothetical protein
MSNKDSTSQVPAVRTIQDEIDAYLSMTDADKKLIRALFNALADLKCPHCHERISTTINL